MNTLHLPSKDKPKDVRGGLGTKKAPGRRASGCEKKGCVYRGEYLSSLKMTWFWGPQVVATALGTHGDTSEGRAGVSDHRAHEIPSSPMRKRANPHPLSEDPVGDPSPLLTLDSSPWPLKPAPPLHLPASQLLCFPSSVAGSTSGPGLASL